MALSIGFHEKEANAAPVVEAINPLKKLLHAKKELNKQVDVEDPVDKPQPVHQFGLAPLVQVEMFLSVLITPGIMKFNRLCKLSHLLSNCGKIKNIL